MRSPGSTRTAALGQLPLQPVGRARLRRLHRENVGSPFAIVLDEEVISAPVIQRGTSRRVRIITGNFTVEESTELAVLLARRRAAGRDGVLEERTIGPELGQDSIEAGRIACDRGLCAVLVFMGLSYGWFGSSPTSR
jgi:preprotein translocase subunit SecD